MSEVIYYIWLSLVCGAGSPLPERLLSHFGDACAVHSAESADYAQLDPPLDEGDIAKLCDKNLDRASRAMEYCERNNVTVIGCDNPIYPTRLHSIRSYPAVLYFRGALPDIDDNVCVAVVGTRSMTEYGRHAAFAFGRGLASGGAVVISGMAKGIDTASHEGALYAGGTTIAVLGCGIDRAYPDENKALMEKIINTGAVVTEFPPYTPPAGMNFPIRNRIISGLCQGVLIVEADERSGALITAKTALYQGKDIFAVPGNIYSDASSGTNRLIKNGARLVSTPADILEEYEFLYPHRIDMSRIPRMNARFEYVRVRDAKSAAPLKVASPPSEYRRAEKKREEKPVPVAGAPNVPPKEEPKPVKEDSKQKDRLSALDDTELAVYKAIGAEKKTTDEIIRSGIKASEVMTALTMLELYGLIENLPGGYYAAKK